MMFLPSRAAATSLFIAWGALLIATGASAGADDRPEQSAYRFPTVFPEHRHLRLLLENALRYASPEHHLIDSSSGYPVEGWNHDP